ncbi:MAG: universal stress protein, partial [Pseudomonadota bacterium]
MLKRILIAVDYDDPVACTISHLKPLAGQEGIEFIPLGVTQTLSSAFTKANVVSMAKLAESIMVQDLRERLADVKRAFPNAKDPHLLSGTIGDEIIKAAALHEADLVVKLADRPSEEKAPLFGATDRKLIRKCPAPVWIVRPEQDTAPTRIAVAVDNTEAQETESGADLQASNLIRHATALADRFGISKVYVIHAWSPVGVHFLEGPRSGLTSQQVDEYVHEWEAVSRKWLNDFLEKAKPLAAKGIDLEPKLVMGNPRRAIPDAVREISADLLVIGSANRTGLQGLIIGNTAEGVIDRTDCGIYVVKP